ncbi:MAG: hypothetical protein V2G42_03630 [bacterium JZ-2024 1]
MSVAGSNKRDEVLSSLRTTGKSDRYKKAGSEITSLRHRAQALEEDLGNEESVTPYPVGGIVKTEEQEGSRSTGSFSR